MKRLFHFLSLSFIFMLSSMAVCGCVPAQTPLYYFHAGLSTYHELLADVLGKRSEVDLFSSAADSSAPVSSVTETISCAPLYADYKMCIRDSSSSVPGRYTILFREVSFSPGSISCQGLVVKSTSLMIFLAFCLTFIVSDIVLPSYETALFQAPHLKILLPFRGFAIQYFQVP